MRPTPSSVKVLGSGTKTRLELHGLTAVRLPLASSANAIYMSPPVGDPGNVNEMGVVSFAPVHDELIRKS